MKKRWSGSHRQIYTLERNVFVLFFLPFQLLFKYVLIFNPKAISTCWVLHVGQQILLTISGITAWERDTFVRNSILTILGGNMAFIIWGASREIWRLWCFIFIFLSLTLFFAQSVSVLQLILDIQQHCLIIQFTWAWD